MKTIKTITKFLIVALIVAISFVGIYVQKQNKMVNIVKDYTWGKDLTGVRRIELKVSEEKETITKDKDGKIVEEDDKKEDEEYTTEEKPANPEDVKTVENYQKSKNIIEKRLKKLGANDYRIKLDEETGTMIVEIPENDETDHIVSNFYEQGKFEIVDSEDTENVLMDSSDIKSSKTLYNTTTSGTTVYLSIEFDKQGAEKLKNISTEYVKVEETTDTSSTSSETDDTSDEEKEETKQKEITMQIDGSKMITTSFDEPMENGSIQLSMGQATTDREQLNDYMKSTTTMATILDNGELPVAYVVEGNQYVASDITKDMLIKLAIIEAIVAFIGMIILIIKNKKLGIYASIAYIGFVAIYLLLIRYTNVTLTLEGITAIAIIFILNYLFTFKVLSKMKEYNEEEKSKAIKDALISNSIKLIPVWIISIVFCLVSWMPISSFGMAMFWGLVLIEIYNITITRYFLK